MLRAFLQQRLRYGGDKRSAAALLYDLVNNCGNARDMCSVLWSAFRRRDDASDEALRNELIAVPCGDDEQPDGNLEDLRGAPLERALCIAVRRYVLEIENTVDMFGTVLTERRGTTDTAEEWDVYYAPVCSLAGPRRPINAVSADRYGHLLRGAQHRAFFRTTNESCEWLTWRLMYRIYHRLRAGCATSASELRYVLMDCPILPRLPGSFARSCAFEIPGLNVDALHGAMPNDAITPSTKTLADSMHVTVRMPDFASLDMRRDVWRALAPRAFGRVMRVIWALAAPFYRKRYGCYENVSLCTAVRCEQGSRVTEYRVRSYERELRELRRRLRPDDTNFERYGPPPMASAPPMAPVDPTNVVGLEARIRAVSMHAGSFEAPTYHTTIRAIRDYGDWNAAMFLLVLYDRIIDDLERYCERSDEENEARWRVWRAMLQDATTSQFRHALAPLHVFFHAGELREMLSRSAMAALSLPATTPATRATPAATTGSSDAMETGSSDAMETGSSDATETGSSDAMETGSSDATETGSSDAMETGSSNATEAANYAFEKERYIADYVRELDEDDPIATDAREMEDPAANDARETEDPAANKARETEDSAANEAREMEDPAANDAPDESNCLIEIETYDEPTRVGCDVAGEISDEAALLAHHFHADYVAAFEWAMVDTARGNPNLVPDETYERSSACRRVRRDLRTCVERACSQALWGRCDDVVGLRPAEIARSVRLPAPIVPLLELSLRTCWKRHGVANRAILRLPLYRRYARAIVESTRDYHLFDAVMMQGGGPTCYDLTYDVSQRLVAKTGGAACADPSDLTTAENVLREYHRLDETPRDAAVHVMRRERCCWRPFYGDASWYDTAPVGT